MTTTNGKAPRIGTVVRDRMWDGTHTGTVARREGRSVFVAWHHCAVEEEFDVDQVEMRADAPDELRQWCGGVGIIDPDGTPQIRSLSQAR